MSNQILEREIPGAVDIMGHAHPEAIVTVNLENATRQEGGYFQREAAIDNDGQAAQEEIRVVGVRNSAGPNGEDVVSELTGEVFLPADPEIFIYDDDGNLLKDGRWTYEWDAENRLVAMETRPELDEFLERIRIDFAYDWQGRRLQKKVQIWDDALWQWDAVEERNFHYHGWNLVAELDDGGTVEKSYLWGLDLSGTLEAAGGVGGLLAISDHGENAVYYPAHDGNGNVTALIDSADAIVAALYEYGPFGESIRASGPAADLNPFRFSTKYFDAETELYYYGYRYYSPSMGRWLNRDPVGEIGGKNLYAMISNSPINYWDYLGLAKNCEDLINSPEFKALPPHLQAELLKVCGPPQVICSRCGPSPEPGPRPGLPGPGLGSGPSSKGGGGCADCNSSDEACQSCCFKEAGNLPVGIVKNFLESCMLCCLEDRRGCDMDELIKKARVKSLWDIINPVPTPTL